MDLLGGDLEAARLGDARDLFFFAIGRGDRAVFADLEIALAFDRATTGVVMAARAATAKPTLKRRLMIRMAASCDD